MDQTDHSKEFVLQFARHENDLFRYILTLLPNWNDAEDVLQETATALWTHNEQFDPKRPFLPWACHFAYLHVRNFRSRQRTRKRVFCDQLIDLLADEHAEHRPSIDRQRMALDSCLGKLREADLKLVQLRYGSDQELGQVAAQIGQTPNAIYKTLQRIRRQLMECVSRAVVVEGSA